jgi:hypothetical protein
MFLRVAGSDIVGWFEDDVSTENPRTSPSEISIEHE